MGNRPSDPRLLDRVRQELTLRHYSPRTVEAYVGWVKRYVRYHGLTHPSALGSEAITGFLSHLANEEAVSASTQNQALAALLFLYSNVLGRPPEVLGEFVRAKRPERLPVVLSTSEVARVLERMEGVPRSSLSFHSSSSSDNAARTQSIGDSQRKPALSLRSASSCVGSCMQARINGVSTVGKISLVGMSSYVSSRSAKKVSVPFS